MIQVQFYIFKDKSMERYWLYICHVIESAYLEKKNVYIHTDTQSVAEYLDAKLWTFKDTSFIPHTRCTSSMTDCPVLIGLENNTPFDHQDLLINLADEIPSFFRQFKNVKEIVFSEPSVQQSARNRYRYYRDNGCELSIVNI